MTKMNFQKYSESGPTKEQAEAAADHLDKNLFLDEFGGWDDKELIQRARRGHAPTEVDVWAIICLMDYVKPVGRKVSKNRVNR